MTGKTEKNCFAECDRMGLVQALTVLHELKDTAQYFGLADVDEALSVVFCFVDEMVLLLNKIGGKKDG